MFSTKRALLAICVGLLCVGASAQDQQQGQNERPRRQRDRLADGSTTGAQWRAGDTTGPRRGMRRGDDDSTGTRRGRRGEGAAAGVTAGEATASASATGGVQVGTTVQSFTAKDASGQQVSLADHKGKIVVLEWTNPGCPFVQRLAKEGTMKQLAQKYQGQDVVWLAVDSTSDNTAEKSAEWKQQQGLPYPIIVDADSTLARQFGAKTTPHMFIIDKDGQLAYQGAIDDDPNGSKEQDRNYVDEALAKLTAGQKPEVTNTQPYGCGVKYK